MKGDSPRSIERVIEPVLKNLGAFNVRRALPDKARQRVGPFIFWDHMGPADFPPGAGVSVRPHPHIGLATITYLFEGVIVHRDSLGYVQPITAGAVNWMTAGRGIVHSERSPPEMVAAGSQLHGIQAWVALPTELEEVEPRFEHTPAQDIPQLALPGARLKVIAGEAFGISSPVRSSSETVFVEVDLESDAILDADQYEELAVYAVSGEATVDGHALSEGQMAVLAAHSAVRLQAKTDAKLMLLGGAALAGNRIIWWNFVSSSPERLEQAKTKWLAGQFDGVEGDPEFIPLPKE